MSGTPSRISLAEIEEKDKEGQIMKIPENRETLGRCELSGRHRGIASERASPGFLLAWPPLQSLAVKKNFFFVQILGGEKLLKFGEKWAVKIF